MSDALNTYRFGPPGPTQVLAIHGLTGHGRRWETLATRHLSDITVVAPDLLGHGRSSWDAPWTIDANVAALVALLDADGSDRVVVVGHSFGGAIALSLAAALIGRLRSLWVTFAGGLAVGLLQAVATPYNSITAYRTAAPFVLAIVALLYLARHRTVTISRATG